MNPRLRVIRLAVLLGSLSLLGGGAAAVRAQTPEGTVITNTATVSFTDANGNSYTPVSASVNVTVAFQAGIDLTGSASVAPASPSTADT
ncbi:MAG TPA: hypothetical protein VI383_04445, partial [Gemmatimonadales bacterium]|nr:hypothetical protein [Gemmatimonadales bacterium]